MARVDKVRKMDDTSTPPVHSCDVLVDKEWVGLTFKHPKWTDQADKGWKRVSFMKTSDMKVDTGVKECNFSGKGNAAIIPSACYQQPPVTFTFAPFKFCSDERNQEERK